jgi:hypothetical protein
MSELYKKCKHYRCAERKDSHAFDTEFAQDYTEIVHICKDTGEYCTEDLSTCPIFENMIEQCQHCDFVDECHLIEGEIDYKEMHECYKSHVLHKLDQIKSELINAEVAADMTIHNGNFIVKSKNIIKEIQEEA